MCCVWFRGSEEAKRAKMRAGAPTLVAMFAGRK